MTTATSAVCKFFLGGDCKHGNSCRFSHHQQQQQQQNERWQHMNQRRGYSIDGSKTVFVISLSSAVCP